MHPLKSFKQTVNLVVEYTTNGQRVQKSFTDAYKARQFYTAKSKAGANPKLSNAHKEQTMSENTTTVATPKVVKDAKVSAENGKITSSNELKKQILKFMRKGTRFTSREIVEGLGRTPGQAQGGPVVRILHQLAEEKVVKKLENIEGVSGYMWTKVK